MKGLSEALPVICLQMPVKFSPDDDAAFDKAHFLAHLLVHVPIQLAERLVRCTCCRCTARKAIFCP